MVTHKEAAGPGCFRLRGRWDGTCRLEARVTTREHGTAFVAPAPHTVQRSSAMYSLNMSAVMPGMLSTLLSSGRVRVDRRTDKGVSRPELINDRESQLVNGQDIAFVDAVTHQRFPYD